MLIIFFKITRSFWLPHLKMTINKLNKSIFFKTCQSLVERVPSRSILKNQRKWSVLSFIPELINTGKRINTILSSKMHQDTYYAVKNVFNSGIWLSRAAGRAKSILQQVISMPFSWLAIAKAILAKNSAWIIDSWGGGFKCKSWMPCATQELKWSQNKFSALLLQKLKKKNWNENKPYILIINIIIYQNKWDRINVNTWYAAERIEQSLLPKQAKTIERQPLLLNFSILNGASVANKLLIIGKKNEGSNICLGSLVVYCTIFWC